MPIPNNDSKNNPTTFMLTPKKDARSIGSYYIGNHQQPSSGYQLKLPSSRVLVPLGGVIVAIVVLAGVENFHEQITLNVYRNVGQANVLNLENITEVGSYGLEVINEVNYIFVSGVKKVDSLLLLSAENNIRQTSLVSQTILSDVMGVAEYYFDYLHAWWKTFKNWAMTYIENILNKWRDFLYGVSETTLVTPVIDESALREQIRLEILAELEGQSADNDTPYVLQDPSGENKGVIVFPATSTIDVAAEIRRMFSDPVDVTFDEASQSGLISPRFQADRGGEYVFLLAPLN